MKTIRIGLILLFSCLLQIESFAQCAMCSATAESSLDSGSSAAEGLNNGVLYLLVMPFLFAAVLIFLYKKYKHIVYTD